MAYKEMIWIRRTRNGRKRSRVKVGPYPFAFFIVSALVIGALAIAVNVNLEDKINGYLTRARHQKPIELSGVRSNQHRDADHQGSDERP